ncbi:MAG: metal-sensitive transcriptional regulator [Bdellovibrionota bacterium]
MKKAIKKAKADFPCHQKELSRLRRIKGQVEGVERMILDRRYCPDILIQIRAARSALKSLEASVLQTHFEHCMQDAAKSGSEALRSQKIKEIMDLFLKS